MNSFMRRGAGAYGRGTRDDVRGAGHKGLRAGGGVRIPVEVSGEDREMTAAGAREGMRKNDAPTDPVRQEVLLPTSPQDAMDESWHAERRAEEIAPSGVEAPSERDHDMRELRLELVERDREVATLRSRLTKCEAELARYRGQCESVEAYMGVLRERGRQDANEECSQLEKKLQETSKRFRLFRDEMNESANAWQRDIYEKIRPLEQELGSMREGLQQTVRSWREEMFKGNYKGVGYSYCHLCSILDRIEAANARRLAEGAEEFPESARLRKWLTEFEAALAGMGLEVIRPRPGEEFDSEWHTLEAGCRKECGLSPDDDLVVDDCVLPGMGYRSDRDDLFVTVVQAVVTASRR